MFIVALILLAVAAYFLLHAYEEWQQEQRGEPAFARTRGGTSGSSPSRASSHDHKDSDSEAGGTPASAQRSSHSSATSRSSGNAGSGGAGSGNAGSGNAGSGRAGSGRAGSGSAGSGSAGSGSAGSGSAGSRNVDAGRAGSGSAGSGSSGSATSGNYNSNIAAAGAVAAGGGAAAYASTSSGSTNGRPASKDTLRFSNRESVADNLQEIKGIGPVLEKDLNKMGVYNFSQIANFSQQDIDNVNTACDFPGRIERDEWIPQARGLATGRSGSTGSTNNPASNANQTHTGGTKISKESLKFTSRESKPDDLQRIKGIGPVLERELNTVGVYNFSQIAEFSQNDIDNVNTAFDFPGRIERDEWIPQAKRLMQHSSSTGNNNRNHSAGLAAAAAATAGGVAAASTIDPARDSAADRKDPATLSDGALTSEIRDRINILRMQEEDAPRLAVSRDAFKSLADGNSGGLNSGRLRDVVKILRWLCDER